LEHVEEDSWVYRDGQIGSFSTEGVVVLKQIKKLLPSDELAQAHKYDSLLKVTRNQRISQIVN